MAKPVDHYFDRVSEAWKPLKRGQKTGEKPLDLKEAQAHLLLIKTLKNEATLDGYFGTHQSLTKEINTLVDAARARFTSLQHADIINSAWNQLRQKGTQVLKGPGALILSKQLETAKTKAHDAGILDQKLEKAFNDVILVVKKRIGP
jgi:hypothetical protein